MRQEFRQHAALPVTSTFWKPFFEQWEAYYHTLGQQFLLERAAKNSEKNRETPHNNENNTHNGPLKDQKIDLIDARLGRKLSPHEIEALSEEQIGQLHALREEATKPSVEK